MGHPSRRSGHRSGGRALGSLVALTVLSAAVTFAAVAGAAAAATPLLAHDWSTGAPAPSVALEGATATAVLVLGAGWAARYAVAAGLGVTVAAAARGGRRVPRAEVAVRAWAPPVVRRAVALSMGGALGLGLVAAPASASPRVPDDLRWSAAGAAPSTVMVVADQQPTPSETGPAPLSAARQGPGVPAAHHEVRAGESLWSIAADSLEAGGEPATVAAVATAWPRWYEVNADVIGPDPGLIRPGQLLIAPEEGPQS